VYRALQSLKGKATLRELTKFLMRDDHREFPSKSRDVPKIIAWHVHDLQKRGFVHAVDLAKAPELRERGRGVDMDVEKTIAFILDHKAQAEVRMERLERAVSQLPAGPRPS
jgi:hypothetical protein